jgi:hypothetical protein
MSESTVERPRNFGSFAWMQAVGWVYPKMRCCRHLPKGLKGFGLLKLATMEQESDLALHMPRANM